MKSLLEFMSEPWDVELPFDSMPEGVLSNPPSRLQVAVALIYKNHGKIRVSGRGITTGGGPYGCRGLSQAEAITLIEMASFLEGWLTATGGVEEEVLSAAIHAEHDRVDALIAEGKAQARG